uniref:Uncharacterized protein n=1 Tax=Rhizophora mucronata TaxID=61149 RepID=A0A2P2NW44_RHIMU
MRKCSKNLNVIYCHLRILILQHWSCIIGYYNTI